MKPCPFCGTDENVDHPDTMMYPNEKAIQLHNYEGAMVVQCGSCGASGPLTETAEQAIESWDIRV